MIKLLNAGFSRLFKNKAFWLITIFTIGFALLIIGVRYNDMKKYGEAIEIGQLILNYPTMIGIIIAIFTSLFLGVEHSDGAIRNKISIGHKRINIYLSNLIITTITCIYFYITFIAVIAVVGIPLFGIGTTTIAQMLIKILIVFACIVAYSSIFAFLSNLISNKTIIAITTILIAFGLMMFGIYCYSMLDTPKTIQQATMENGETTIQEIPNPKYPSEQAMKTYQILLDVNPAGQIFQLNGRDLKLEELPLYSLCIFVIFTTSGLVLFERKEIK